VAYFKVLSLNFPGYAEERHEKLVRITGFRAESVAWDFSTASRECSHSTARFSAMIY
jgi:hypothetical protein